MQTAYTEHFTTAGAAERYEGKFASRLERLRHQREVEFLVPHARGALFDCSIGTGRLIAAFPRVTSYAGMDYSTEFIDYVHRRHPEVPVKQGDLRNAIPEDDGRFDTTLCLRTLSALGAAKLVLSEMARITRPGGTILCDYGRRPRQVTMGDSSLTVDAEDIEGIISRLGLCVVARYPVDGLIVLIKRWPRLWRFANGRGLAWFGDRALLGLEKATENPLHERIIYVARKA